MSDGCKEECLKRIKEIEKQCNDIFNRIQKQADCFENDIVLAKYLQALMQKLEEAEVIVENGRH